MSLRKMIIGLGCVLAAGALSAGPVLNGCDVLFEKGASVMEGLRGKRVGLMTNHTGRLLDGTWTLDKLAEAQEAGGYTLSALFALEHGVRGHAHAEEGIEDSALADVPVYSLYGTSDASLHPTDAMLDSVDVILFDISDIGSRSYTYASSLFYVMEDVGKYNERSEREVKVVVLDRPNPLGGKMVDGPRVQEGWDSFIGVMPIPFCHGMTVGELATLFNNEYSAKKAPLEVVKMGNWSREMLFGETGQLWVPPSPNVPEQTTPRLYPITVMGEGLTFLNVGKGNPLPFRVALAPWIDGVKLCAAFEAKMQELGLKGVRCVDFNASPFFGSYTGEECAGVLIDVTDAHAYQPVATQYALLEALAEVHPKEVRTQLQALYDIKDDKEKRLHRGKALSAYHQACWLMGTDAVLEALLAGEFDAKAAIKGYQEELASFKKQREGYLLY